MAKKAVCCFEHGDQGGTYNGNPLMCAVGLAVLEVVGKPAFLDTVNRTGSYLTEKLQSLSRRLQLGEVRGRGLMIGMGMRDHDLAVDFEQAAFRRGLLVLSCGDDAVRMAPPLVLRPDQVDTAVALLEETLVEVAGA